MTTPYTKIVRALTVDKDQYNWFDEFVKLAKVAGPARTARVLVTTITPEEYVRAALIRKWRAALEPQWFHGPEFMPDDTEVFEECRQLTGLTSERTVVFLATLCDEMQEWPTDKRVTGDT